MTRSAPRIKTCRRLVATGLAVATASACSADRGNARPGDLGPAIERSTTRSDGGDGEALVSVVSPRSGLARTHGATARSATFAASPSPDAAAHIDMVTIRLLVEPPNRAHVHWGAKDFGLGPLDIRRPRGSGPLDLVLRAPGFLTLHTRVFTDRDNSLSVHLVPEAEASRFPGYQSPDLTGPAKAGQAFAGKRRRDAPVARDAKEQPKPTPPASADPPAAGPSL